MLQKIKKSSNKSEENKIYSEFNFIMNFDGCSKGNPGISGAGAVIYNNNTEICSASIFVGENETNNYAEYKGLILGLQKAIELNIKQLLVIGDSQLIINQMEGLYKCLSPNLIELYEESKKLEQNFDKIIYKHVLRKLNKRADFLSNEGLKLIF